MAIYHTRLSLKSKFVINKIEHLKNRRGQLLSMVSLISLSACGGGGGTPAPIQPQTPDYTESPIGTFTAKDNTNLTLSQGSATTDLIVNSKGGNDSITTGSGADTIKGGAGNDTINAGDGNNIVDGEAGDDTITTGTENDDIRGGTGADTITSGEGSDTIDSGDGNDIIRPNQGADVVSAGAGDDIIVVVGTTAADEYAETDITNPGGSGNYNVSGVLSLAELNNHSTSDILMGDSIDGGDGSDTLVIYGTVDLTGITIQNISTLQVNSTVTLTAAQLQQFTVVNGDGSSVLNIVNETEGETLVLDLSNTILSDIATIITSGSVQVIISSADDLAGIASITGSTDLTIVLTDDGTGTNSINSSDLTSVVSGVTAIEVEATVTLVIDDTTSIADMSIEEMGGAGTIVVSNTAAVSSTLLSGVIIDEDVTLESASGTALVTADFGGTLIADIDPSDVGVLPEMSITDITAGEADELATFTVSLNARFYDAVTVHYTAPDGTTGILTFAAGETEKTFTTAWTDDSTDEDDAIVTATISNPTNATITDNAGTLTILDNDVAPTISIDDISTNETDAIDTFTVSLSAASGKTITVDYTAPDGTTGTLTFAAGETSQTFTTAWDDDVTLEVDETVTATLSNPINATIADGSGALLILDDDDPVAVFELSGLEGFNGFRFDGVAAGDWSGTSVSSAGDVNGDGYDDFIIGADGADPNGGDTGSGYVVFGAANGFAATTNLATLDGTNGFRLDGMEYTELVGSSVSDAGDVNGDGYDDIIISGMWASPNGIESGSSYVVFGAASGFAASTNLSTLDGTNGFRLDGEAAGDWSGYSVSSAGDVNGDGYDDIIIGALYADNGSSNSGSSYVVFGAASGFAATTNLSTLDGTNGFRLDGAAADDNSGFSVSGAGDVNGDGYDDIIIGAFGADQNGNFSGSSYVVFGAASGFAATTNLSTLDGTNGFRLDGDVASDMSGRSVSSAGDINGDGYDDIIIGAQGADNGGSGSGSSYVVFGAASGFAATTNLSALDGTNGFRLDGNTASDWSGASVSGAGDVNGDGYDDLIIGASGADNGGSGSGSSYVVYGAASGYSAIMDLSTLDGTNGFRLDGVAVDDFSGRSVSGAGDVNGDGYDDLIIGAVSANPNGGESGSSYIVFGHAISLDIKMGTMGNDSMTGTANDERFIGRSGDDTITSGDGNDVLVFDDAFGDDTVTDFTQGADIFDFSDYDSIDDISDLIITIVSGDTVIDDGNGNTITLTGFVDTLSNSDFDFI